MRRAAVGHNQKIERAIVIDIGESRTTRYFRNSERSSDLVRNFFELAGFFGTKVTK
jgi:hypothetical protein